MPNPLQKRNNMIQATTRLVTVPGRMWQTSQSRHQDEERDGDDVKTINKIRAEHSKGRRAHWAPSQWFVITDSVSSHLSRASVQSRKLEHRPLR